MTDLTPNDLSHLSDEEFHALCPQGYHAPGPAEPLSAAAQAILHEFWDAPISPVRNVQIAAALRAATDQVVPEEVIWASEDALVVGQDIRERFLAIAAELEGN